jgi:PKHD-type hydroxylase
MLDQLLSLDTTGARSLERRWEDMAEADFICQPMKFPGVLSREECRAIVALGRKGGAITAGLARPVEGYRKGPTRLLPLTADSKWLYDRVRRLLVQVNQWYRFDITAMVDSLLYCEYPDKGQFDWHIDCGESPTSTRKISLSLQLSDASEYEGGGLEFAHYGELREGRGVGTAIAFPAFVHHRVAPVTRGIRRSLVAWAHGPVFR